MSDRCPDTLDDVQCELRAGHDPRVHVSGAEATANRTSWLLGTPHDLDASDSELDWADGFPANLK